MPLAARIASLTRNLFRRRRVERELAEELDALFDLLVEEKQGQGKPPAEARRLARLELGSRPRVQDDTRDVRIGAGLDALAQHLRLALRGLRKSPGFTVVAVLTLALGIGATATIFAVVHPVLFRDLPYPDAGQLVTLEGYNELHGWQGMPIPDGAFAPLSENSETLAGLAGYRTRTLDLSGTEEPVRLEGAAVSANLFPLLGVAPRLGRGFRVGEDQLAQPTVAVLGHDLWVRIFAADPGVVGRVITLGDRLHTVIGVMPEDFRFPGRSSEIWVPVSAGGEGHAWTRWQRAALGRLKPGVTLSRAQAEIDSRTEGFAENLPFGEGWRFSGTRLMDQTVGEVRPALLLLFGAVGLVLLVACANVANLLLARATSRKRELAVRAALGASRGRLLAQLMTESLVLSLLGALGGMLIVHGALQWIVARLPGDFPRVDEIGMDGSVLLFSLAAALFTALVAGTLPALGASQVDLIDTIKRGTGTAGGSPVARRLARHSLVAAELALSVLLIVGAALLLRSFLQLTEVEPGFQSTNVTVLGVELPQNRYDATAKVAAFVDELVGATANLPAVESQGVSTGLPTRGVRFIDGSLTLEASAGQSDKVETHVAIDFVDPGYFEVLSIPLRRGRGFGLEDSREGNPVAIVNEAFVRRFSPDREPIGRRVLAQDDETWLTIVGVVGDVKQYGPAQDAPIQLFRPFAQGPQRRFFLVLRAAAGVPLGDLKAIVQRLDPALPLPAAESLTGILDDAVAPQRFNALLMSTFGVVSLALAAVGAFGVVSYSVTRRTREIGIRIALGARARTVLCLAMGQGMGAAVVGVTLGLIGAWALGRYVETLLFGVTATDPAAFAAATALMLGVAALACLVPAVRATRIDPLRALREE